MGEIMTVKAKRSEGKKIEKITFNEYLPDEELIFVNGKWIPARRD